MSKKDKKMIEDSNKELSTEREKEQSSNIKLYFGIGVALVIVWVGFQIVDFFNTTVLDMKDYVLITYDHNTYETKPSYYASFEHFNKDNFYDDLYQQGKDYGLSQNEIKTLTPSGDSDTQKMFKNLELEVKLNKETVEEGDTVGVDISYNEKYARKHDIKVKNASFDTKVEGMRTHPDSITSGDLKPVQSDITDKIKQSSVASKFDLDSATGVKYYTTQDNGVKLVATFSGDFKSGLLGKSSDGISFEMTPFYQNGKLGIEDDIKMVNASNLQLGEI